MRNLRVAASLILSKQLNTSNCMHSQPAANARYFGLPSNSMYETVICKAEPLASVQGTKRYNQPTRVLCFHAWIYFFFPKNNL